MRNSSEVLPTETDLMSLMRLRTVGQCIAFADIGPDFFQDIWRSISCSHKEQTKYCFRTLGDLIQPGSARREHLGRALEPQRRARGSYLRSRAAS